MSNLSYPEILAPCGSYEILVAAVRAGANACYIGGNKFGARAYATNISDEDIKKALDYAHLHNVKVYLTVNTLFKNNEIEELFYYILPYYEAGIDALIIQDLGVFSFIREYFPDLPIHCSTQMNITSYHAAGMMRKYGATRVVPARELTLSEIKAINDNVDVEIEAFVHGAMCYSYSGQCLFSSMAGGRSGNRGRCAQPCRKCYDEKYYLSMKDMCCLENIPNLIEAGIDSFKIEGRMKNAYYVYSAVEAYKELIEDYFNNEFSLKKASYFKNKLANIFNRGGFCGSYFSSIKGLDMISIDRPNNKGVCIGTVVSIVNGQVKIKLQEDLFSKDVLEVKLKDNSIIEITSKTDGKKGQTVSLNAPRTKDIVIESKVLRTRCNKLIDEIEQKINTKKKIPITCDFIAKKGKNCSILLTYFDTEKDISCYIESDYIVQKSENKVLDKEDLILKLSMLGDTEFYFEDIILDVDYDAFIPASLVKKLRRSSVEELKDKICESFYRDSKENVSYYEKNMKKIHEICNQSKNNVTYEIDNNIGVMNLEQLMAVVDSNFTFNGLYIRKDVYVKAYNEGLIDTIKSKNIKIYLELPFVIKDTFNIINYLDNVEYDGLCVRNIDSLACLKKNKNNIKIDGKKIIIGSSLYTYNNYARYFISDIFKNVVFESPKELSADELKKLYSNDELTIYEYQQVMLSAQCVNKIINGCDKRNSVIKVTDEKGNAFYNRCICDECLNVVYNGVCLSLSDKLETDLNDSIKPSSYRINFTIEDYDGVRNTLDMFFSGEKKGGRFTYGHYYRGVE